MDNFDDFDTQIQSDELIPWDYSEDDDAPHGLTADERDERGLYSQWRDECFSDAEDGDDDELCAVFGADDPDNYLGHDEGEGEDGADDDDW